MFPIKYLAAGAVMVIVGWPVDSIAATLNVPGDFPTIQACIDAAVSGVDECVVAPGTYHETINFLGKAITLRSSGGADVTTIDATGIGGSVVTCATGEGPDTVLDGFTITGGTGTLAQYGFTYGGGMFNDSNSGPTVTNCTFSGNIAVYGGGMYNDSSSPTVTNCTFSENTAIIDIGKQIIGSGGGIYNDYSDPMVTNCTFSRNNAGHNGGGMFNSSSSPTVTNCAFSGNAANYAGGMYNSYYSNPTVAYCTFSGNMANYGGGMHNYRSSPTVMNCTLTGNTATAGGGMANEESSRPTVTDCMFSGNTATHSGGGMYNTLRSTPTVTDCTFSRNTATGSYYGFGGAICNTYSSSPTVTNCTFRANRATGSYSAQGGGIYNAYSASPTVYNCVLWDDSPDELYNDKSSPTIRFSNVQGGLPASTVDGGGNINVDPVFVRPPDPGPDGVWDGVDDDYGDLRLQAGSPCINTGDPNFVAQPGETDLEGHARVLCGRVDMGAYEFGIGDYDCNQTINLLDFSMWDGCMNGPSDLDVFQSSIENRQSTIPCDAFDFDADGHVDLFDFAAFQGVFQGPSP